MKGQCLCGAVTIEAEPGANPLAGRGLGACHCDMCRRWTSSAFVEVSSKPGSVTVEGPVKVFTSSRWAERAFCSECGSALWYRLTADDVPDKAVYQLSAGLFDNAAGLELELEVFIDKKPDGYAFAGERKTMTGGELEAMFVPDGSGPP